MRKTPQKSGWIVGIDEVGRGPIAGPVTVCAVAMPLALYKKSRWVGLTDSKKLSRKSREKWFGVATELEQKGVLRIARTSKSAAQIDRYGIAHCIQYCISDALKKLALDPHDTHILLDGGLKAPSMFAFQETIIKGDLKHKIISLASVVAKVSRDAYMTRMHKKHPQFGWANNMGYGTKGHYVALIDSSPTKLHRRSFLSRVL